MTKCSMVRGDSTELDHLETKLRGTDLLNAPLLNKQCAFSNEERHALGIAGLMPSTVETLEEQLRRELDAFESYETLLERSLYLAELRDRNEVLYFRLALEHVEEMLPILYTPEVGDFVKNYSHSYARPRGLYISYNDEDSIEEILSNRCMHEVDVIVVTDSGAILGIGDQGVGGMGIPIAKLALDSLCGAVHPARALPITLDVGTNNKALLDDPLYMGWRHERVEGADYERFIEKFVGAIKKHLPGVLLHWEDFARDNAERNLETYRDRICSFNDDIQGTAAVAVATLYAALKATGQTMRDQRVVVFGSGAAGLGNADQILAAMQREGLTQADAHAQIWALDRYGLVVEGMEGNTSQQQPYARSAAEVADWSRNEQGQIDLAETVHRTKPTILIGTSTVSGAFNEAIVREMAASAEHPIIFPMSNPTEKAEAHPSDLLKWTDGRALIATGSPFDSVKHASRTIRIGQSNNAFIFPGLTLGVIATGASRISDDMLWAAMQALSDLSPALQSVDNGLLPTVDRLREVCLTVGTAVAQQVVDEGLAREPLTDTIEATIERHLWTPHYLPVFPVT